MTTDKNKSSWIKRIYKFIDKNKFSSLVSYTLAYINLKLILLHFKESSFCDWNGDLLIPCKYIIKPIGNDILANMDILAYFIGLFTFYIGLKITFQLDKQNEEKQNELQRATNEIKNTTNDIKPITETIIKTTEQLPTITSDIKSATNEISPATKQISKLTLELVDSLRKSLPNIPSILKEIQDILNHTGNSKEEAELFIMNRISEFGRMHTYNPRFANEFKKNLPKFIEELNRANSLLGKCFNNKNVKSHLLTYTSREKIEHFIEDYFKAEDDKDELKLHINSLYSNVESNDQNQKREAIKEQLILRHNNTIDEFKNSNNSEVINSNKELPKMIIYLANYIEGNHRVWRTLVVFSVDEKDDKGDIQRKLFGLTSSTKNMYDVFRTYFY